MQREKRNLHACIVEALSDVTHGVDTDGAVAAREQGA
jgi:hypothetical protein